MTEGSALEVVRWFDSLIKEVTSFVFFFSGGVQIVHERQKKKKGSSASGFWFASPSGARAGSAWVGRVEWTTGISKRA
jgi:hypothetical protein